MNTEFVISPLVLKIIMKINNKKYEQIENLKKRRLKY